MAEKQTVHSGHTIRIRMRNALVGRLQSVDGERSFGTEGVYEIGSMMPQELVNNRYEGMFSCERFYVRKKDLARIGLASVGEEVLKKEPFVVEVVDNYTGEVVRSYHGCTISQYRENIRVNSIAGENATFMYLYAK